MTDTTKPPKAPSTEGLGDETDTPTTHPSTEVASQPRANRLGRRGFLSLSALGIPVLASGCADDPSSSGDGEGGTGGDGDTGDGDGDTGDGDGGETGSDGGDGGEPIEFDPDGVDEDIALFPRTPISGEMTSSRVMVAVYVSDASAKTLRFWRPSATEGEVVLVADVEVAPDENGFAKVWVEDLSPGTWYTYAVFDGDADAGFTGRSLICQVRTALADDALEPLTVTISACNGGYYDPTNPPSSPFTWASMSVLANQYFDVFLHLGDQAYMDSVFSNGGAYTTYLEAWGAFHGGGYREVYPKAGVYATWDDHEVTDNGSVNPWSRASEDISRIENAIEAYYTVMPIDATTSMDPLWRSFRWGATAEFIVLDSRYERSPRAEGEYISPAQLEFLKDRLKNSPCHFKVVLNSVPFATLTGWLGIQADDRWEGYPDQRQEIIDYIDNENIENVWWVAGDIHTTYVGDIDAEPGPSAASRMKEICVTSGNSNPVAGILDGTQFEYKTGDPRVPLLTFDPINNEVLVKILDDAGTVVYEETLSQI